MLLHREERLAYSVSEALDLLENKNLAGKHNRYLEDFKLFTSIDFDVNNFLTSCIYNK